MPTKRPEKLLLTDHEAAAIVGLIGLVRWAW